MENNRIQSKTELTTDFLNRINNIDLPKSPPISCPWSPQISKDKYLESIKSIKSYIVEAKKLYFGVGSAVTFDADPVQEYEECQLKTQAIFEILRGARVEHT